MPPLYILYTKIIIDRKILVNINCIFYTGVDFKKDVIKTAKKNIIKRVF